MLFSPDALNTSYKFNILPLSNRASPFIRFSIEDPLPNSFTINNVHGNKVVFANKAPQNADGHIFTTALNQNSLTTEQYLAIKTADCLPIAFVYQENNVYLGGITHAGWRGLSAHIISETLLLLNTQASFFNISKNAFYKNLKVFVCPAIFGVSYECGEDVKLALEHHKQYLQKNATHSLNSSLYDICSNVRKDSVLSNEIEKFAIKYGRKLQKNTVYPDLQLLAVLECLSLGVLEENLYIFRENTYGHEFLPSFRQASHAHGDKAKRLWSHLCLPYAK